MKGIILLRKCVYAGGQRDQLEKRVETHQFRIRFPNVRKIGGKRLGKLNADRIQLLLRQVCPLAGCAVKAGLRADCQVIDHHHAFPVSQRRILLIGDEPETAAKAGFAG